VITLHSTASQTTTCVLMTQLIGVGGGVEELGISIEDTLIKQLSEHALPRQSGNACEHALTIAI